MNESVEKITQQDETRSEKIARKLLLNNERRVRV